MFQSNIQMLIIIQVLRGIECQDFMQFDQEITLPVNITDESLDIVDCYINAVNTPWNFSDEQDLNVSYLQNITQDHCDRNSRRIFQCNYPLMNHLQKATFLSNESYHEEAEFYNTELFRSNSVEHYEKATELQRQASQTMKDLVDQMQYIKQEAETRNEFGIFTDNCSLIFLDMETLQNKSLRYSASYNETRISMEISRIRTYALRYYFLPFVAVVFTFGMLGNGLLLLIFVRHPKTRSGPNVMLVNLAVTDSLFIVNIAIDYCRLLWGFPFGIEACYVYNFVRSLITIACVYSMTILSFSRYIAVTANPGSSYKLTSMPVMLATVWIISAIVAIPDTLTSKIVRYTPHKSDCTGDSTPTNAISDYLFISLLPMTAISCFYIAASRRLRRSVRKMPGQALGHEKVKMARERGAKILPGLIFVFAITFLPIYTYVAIVVVFDIDFEESISHNFYFVVYFLSNFNINCVLNPVSLYLTSGMFRKHINIYITLGMAKKHNSPNGSDKSYTVSSKL